MMLEIAIAATAHGHAGEYNERHLSATLSEAPFFVSAYHNSENSLSLALGARTEAQAGPVTLFCEGGVVTGYKAAPVVPLARCGGEVGRVRGFVFPDYKVGKGMKAGVGIEVILMRFE